MKVLRKAFKEPLSAAVTKFVSSIEQDKSIVEFDLAGSIAHVEMLAQSGLITSDQASNLLAGLHQILELFKRGEFILDVDNEDVHMNVEVKLEELIGSDAKLLHTARSRNDQVALDMRLFVLDRCRLIARQISPLQASLKKTALQNLDAIMPGYTHLQRAQPVLFAHVLHAFCEMVERDSERFLDCAKRADRSPLGAGALVGSGLSIKPEISAEKLRMSGIFANSIDAVSDRDFVAEFLFACSLTAIHLSQMAETLIIWCSKEFGFIEFPDGLTTTSSLMPQKKNPDPMELVRGKTGHVVGDLVALLVTLKGLPAGYNRDLQETKVGAIESSASLLESLNIMELAFSSIKVCKERTLQAGSDPELFATDLVEYLVRKGTAFRAAHDAIGQLVQSARDQSVSLDKLTLEQYQEFSKHFEKDVYSVFDPVQSVRSKTSHGSTNPDLVRAQLEK